MCVLKNIFTAESQTYIVTKHEEMEIEVERVKMF